MIINDLYSHFKLSYSVSTDTRNIVPGSIFFALKGGNFDGNRFANDALSKGASFAVIDDSSFHTGDQTILVDDVLTTLQQLANHHRKVLGIPILGITGTNGKTTTKELVAVALETKFKVTYTQGNLNNHIGVPLTLLSMTKSTEFGVVEMGANHQGEIAELCSIAEPDFGLITNVGKAHLEGFGSFEGVKKTKSELYRFLEIKEGLAFLHFENEHLNEKRGHVKTITYSTKRNNDAKFMAELVDASPFLTLKVKYPKGYLFVRTKLIGEYNLENVTAACAIANYFDCDPIAVQKALESYTPSNNRSQFVKTENNRLILDAYNANPTSMEAAISNFNNMKGANKVVILGDMLELGEESEKEHQIVIDSILNCSFSKTILVGPKFSSLNDNEKLITFSSVEEARQYLLANNVEDSLILIKGSRGIKLESLTPFL